METDSAIAWVQSGAASPVRVESEACSAVLDEIEQLRNEIAALRAAGAKVASATDAQHKAMTTAARDLAIEVVARVLDRNQAAEESGLLAAEIVDELLDFEDWQVRR